MALAKRIAGTGLVASLALLTACGAAPGDESSVDTQSEAVTAAIPSSHCLYGITNYSSTGPFSYTTKTVNTYVKMWIPNTPSGCKIPVVHFANGTTATCSMYAGVLQRLASHGFFAVCYENSNTGAGDYGITAINTALSKYSSQIDYRIGSMGHSQGGQASIVTLAKAESKWASKAPVIAGLAIEPASGYGTQPSGSWQSWYAKVKSPVFMFSGNSSTGFLNSSLLGLGVGDGLVSITWVRSAFDALANGTEAYHWTRTLATHIPVPNSQTNEVAIAWFRWKLLGDKKACQAFKNLKGINWIQQQVQAEKSCN